MLKLSFDRKLNPVRRLLCLGAHSDDLEIGCGGTVLRILEEIRNVEISWIVFSASGERKLEAGRSAEKFLAGAGKREISIEGFRDGYFPYVGADIKDYFEKLKSHISPDLIFTHFREDLHQDHRTISELTWNTFRNHFILEYEVLKYDGDLGKPNFYITLNKEICRRKIDTILNSFQSQKNRSWFTPDAFMSIMRLRGVEINSPGDYAEAFYGRKIYF